MEYEFNISLVGKGFVCFKNVRVNFSIAFLKKTKLYFKVIINTIND